VSRDLAEAIVKFLASPDAKQECAACLTRFTQCDWERTLAWLHDSGLALYFLRRLKDTNTTSTIPAGILQQLEENQRCNQARTECLAGQFRILNQAFDQAGVHYAVIKGFSLVPQFCPNAYLRPQSDLDYLVDEQSLSMAQDLLEKQGYALKSRRQTELIFVPQGVKPPPRAQEQYSARAAYAVELHLTVWETEDRGLKLPELRFAESITKRQQWRDLRFPTLSDEDAYLLQVIHAFQHILTSWIRMSCFYEMGYFLKHRAQDARFWKSIEDHVGEDSVLKEVVVLITELTAQFFQAAIPATIKNWAGELRPAARVWIQNYARDWAFGKNCLDDLSLFPTAKLVLFLHQQYLADGTPLIRSRLLPLKAVARIARSVKNPPKSILEAHSFRRKRLARRVFFHATASLRYLWETPRWRRLNKSAEQTVLV
jgi:hypothetical protein